MTEQMGNKRRFRIGIWILIFLLPLLAVAIIATRTAKPSEGSAAAPPELATLEAMQRGFAWIAETTKPSVVFIEVEQKVARAETPEEEGPELEIPDPWRDFFGMPRQRQQPMPPRIPIGQGSGVIIDPSGFILTNNHVVGDAAKVTVHLANGETYPAEVIGTDKLTDLAVIKINPKKSLVAAKLGDASKEEVGSWVMAVGYPFGGGKFGGRFDEPLHYEATVTVGVVSATNRQIDSGVPGRPFRDLVQTDAPINPGNSGGPMVNVHAEVIGINQAIFTSGLSLGNIGVGFAIPINARTKQVIKTLQGGESVVRGRIGILVAPLTDPLKKVYGADYGVFVEEVESDGPAARAGVKNEDIITKFGGEKVVAQDEFVNLVQSTKPGSVAEMEVLRDGKPVTIKITVEPLTGQVAARKPPEPETTRMGLAIEPLTEAQMKELKLEGGVRVRGVNPIGDAARAGIQAGDIVIKINRDNVTDVESYKQIVAKLKKGDPVVIRIWRGGHVTTAQIDSLSD